VRLNLISWSLRMTAYTSLAAILAALLLGAMSPGPSFIMVARSAASRSRADGCASALGMGIGGALFAGLALLGLYSLLSAVTWLYALLKVAGGAYLLYLAFKIWRGARHALVLADGTRGTAAAGSRDVRRSLLLGLSTQLSNPKTAIAYGGIFAALLPAHPPAWYYAVLPPLVFAVEAGWYTVVALAFSSARPQRLYLKCKTWIDRGAAGALGALGLRLVWTARHTGI
jgi:threonine/homoserine/homoserine lactone efflux protein